MEGRGRRRGSPWEGEIRGIGDFKLQMKTKRRTRTKLELRVMGDGGEGSYGFGFGIEKCFGKEDGGSFVIS